MLDSPETPQRLALSVKDAARAVSISRSTIYGEISSGRLRTIRIGNRRLVRPIDLEEWVNAHVVAS